MTLTGRIKEKNSIWQKIKKGVWLLKKCSAECVQRLTAGMRRCAYKGICILQGNAGMSVIELLLILVVIIALVLLFKNNLINLVNTIFQKITSESAGI